MAFLDELRVCLPDVDEIIIGGDWNTVLDSPPDQRDQGCAKDVLALVDMMLDLDLQDVYRELRPAEPGYTWFSHRRKVRRLDYLLVGGSLKKQVINVEEANNPVSDHKPVIGFFNLAKEFKRGRGYFKLNTQNLQCEGLNQWTQGFWERWQKQKERFATVAEWWEVGSRIMSKLLDVFSRILALTRNKEERKLRKKVQEAEEKMQRHPISELTWGKERVRRLAEWDEKQQEKSDLWAERLKVKGLEVYDRMSRETFQKLAPARTTPTLKELRHPFDSREPVVVEPEELCKYAVLYYQDILTSRRQGEGADADLAADSDHWNNTTVRLHTRGRLDLDRPITKEEAEEALKAMANGKTPGNDGLPIEFYRQHWKVLGDDLVEIYNEMQMGGKLPDSACRGIISILFKKGDTSEIRNWRPISLLNVSYKILAKVLARRLGRYLPNLVEDGQAAFVRGRSIYENIVTAVEVLEVVSQEDLDVNVLLLDMEKAYDRILGIDVGKRACKVKALADDLFAVSANTVDSMSALRHCLRQYEELSEAAINWSKSVFLLPRKYSPAVDWGMKRVQCDNSEPFLGVQVALTSCALRQEEILQNKVLQRTTVWGKAPHLSLFGRALVANVALFALLTFVGNVRPLGKKIQAVVRRKASTFIWKPYAEEGEGVMSKVAWELICAPRREGGLGMMDPGRRNLAMLARWVVRAIITQNDKHWILLGERILSREWQLVRQSDVWACVWIESYLRSKLKSEFWQAVLQAWRRVKPDMLSDPHTKEEVLSQIIFENQRIRDDRGRMLMANSTPGSFGKTWIKRGVVRLRDLWNEFTGDWRTSEELESILRPGRNIRQRRSVVLESIPDEWKQILSPAVPNPVGTWYEVKKEQDPEGPQLRDFVKLVELSEEGGRKFQQWQSEGAGVKPRLCEEEEHCSRPEGTLVEIRVRETGGWILGHLDGKKRNPLRKEVNAGTREESTVQTDDKKGDGSRLEEESPERKKDPVRQKLVHRNVGSRWETGGEGRR
ncbi:hypothetical protein CBR_g19143 [Chara braunii]|uniref:Reverse transcriptase domain-containing protein n=1 Tax=Chara braunii TaxID=69332 RepID=A0A388KXG4_CHABU|nr:hypothetical protein CBR_g19143 [Chara braunii]|eukprot:GBG74737.1 hypothetical protein CBR_g19143 [Chara braunii]